MAINLGGRVPKIINSLSPRLMWAAIAIFVLAGAAMIIGFHKRVVKKAEMTERRQTQTVASEASTSNRMQVTGGQYTGTGQTPGAATAPPLPLVSTAPSAVATNALPGAPGMLPGTAPGQPGTPMLPGAYPPQTPGNPFPPAPTVPYPSTPVNYNQTPAVDSREHLQSQLIARRLERERQAVEGPTGIADQQAATNSAPLDPVQSQLASLESILRQGPQTATAATPMASYPLGGAVSSAFSSDSTEGTQGYKTQNGQADKRKFGDGDNALGADDYLKAVRTLPLSRWVVQRGTVIPASLPHQVISDLPGDLIAEVVRDVFDSPTQKYVEIPAGSRLVGEYNSSVSYGQGRVQIVWTSIYFPDGTFIDLARFPSHSADGSTGLKDKVDNHYKRLIAGVALTSMLSAGLQLSQNRTNGSVLSYPSTGQVIASGIGTQASQLGEQLTTRNMNIQPTLKIRPGEIFAVAVTKDIVFQGPYQSLVPNK